MTVAQSTRQSGPFTATEGQTVFNYDFPVKAASELKVMRLRGGVEATLELDVDYGVTHVGEDSGTIILTSGSTAGDIITIVGDLPIARTSNFAGWRSIPDNAINDELDRMTKSLQEMRRDVDVSIQPVQAGQAYNIQGLRLTNVADGVADTDAATLGQLKPFADAAAASAATAATSEGHVQELEESTSTLNDAAQTAKTAAEAAADRAENAASSGVVAFDTYDEAAAATSLSEDVTTIIVSGRSALDDWGGAIYEKVSAAPANAGLQVGTFFFKNVSKEYTPEHFGAKGDGLVDDGPSILTWLLASADEGRKAIVRGGKTYIIGDPVVADFNKDLVIEGVKGSVFKGAAGDGIVIELRHNTNSTDRDSFPNLSVSGLIIDNSLRNFVSAEQSGTALSLVRMKKAEIFNNIMMGDPAWATSAKGDSGITAVTCVDLNFHDNLIQDQPDLAIYMSGGSDYVGSTDDYGEWKTYANQIYRCNAGFAAKRATRRVLFANNILRNITSVGYLGTAGALGNDSTPMLSAREQIVIGNIFSKVGTRVIELEQSKNDIICGNQIEDFGYQQDGVTPSGTAIGIRLLGVLFANVSNNNVSMREWTNTASHYGVRIERSTFNSVNVESSNNAVVGNGIFGITNGIVELNSSNNNRIEANHLPSVATTNKIQKAAGSISSGWTLKGSFASTHGAVSAGNRIQQTCALAGVEVGDFAVMDPATSGLHINGIIFQLRCVAGAVLVDARNTSGSTITLPGDTFNILVFKG